MISLYMIILFYVLMKNKEKYSKILNNFLHSFPNFLEFQLDFILPR